MSEPTAPSRLFRPIPGVRSLRGVVPPGLGGLVALAVAGVWMAWQAGRVNAIEPVAPFPIELPTSSLMGSVATLSAPEPGHEARLAAPTPAPLPEPDGDPARWAPAEPNAD